MWKPNSGILAISAPFFARMASGAMPRLGKLQAGAIEERAYQVAEVDDPHIRKGKGFLQEADGTGIEVELEMYDSEQTKGKEQAAHDGDLYAHKGGGTYADEYPCPYGTDECSYQCPPLMIRSTASARLGKVLRTAGHAQPLPVHDEGLAHRPAGPRLCAMGGSHPA